MIFTQNEEFDINFSSRRMDNGDVIVVSVFPLNVDSHRGVQDVFIEDDFSLSPISWSALMFDLSGMVKSFHCFL